ncbi:hypothetical protein JR736_004585 [Escherichia coli]|nr:hypothetical protein [Escherichia coli]
MIKSSLKIADYRKVLRYQNTLRVAELVRAILSAHPKATEEELRSIFEQDYTQEVIDAGIKRARNYVSIKKTK